MKLISHAYGNTFVHVMLTQRFSTRPELKFSDMPSFFKSFLKCGHSTANEYKSRENAARLLFEFSDERNNTETYTELEPLKTKPMKTTAKLYCLAAMMVAMVFVSNVNAAAENGGKENQTSFRSS